MNAATMTRPAAPTARPGKRCPRYKDEVLDGGPVQFWCPLGHRVQAADLSVEVTR